jgi:hypothetical protein
MIVQSAMHGSNGDAKSVSDIEKCDVAFQNLTTLSGQELIAKRPAIVKDGIWQGAKKLAIFNGWTQPTTPESCRTILNVLLYAGSTKLSFCFGDRSCPCVINSLKSNP